MSPEAVKASYARTCKDLVTLRRYTGAGPNRIRFDVENIRSRVTGYAPHELNGTIVQGDRKIILFADDLLAKGFALPVTTNDKVVVRGRELEIMAPDDSTRRVNGVLIAIELQVRGA
jgi:hypothetical protein